MGTIEVTLSREIGKKKVLAVLSFSAEDFDEQEEDEKPKLMMEAYQQLVQALDEAEVDLAIQGINQMPFPEIQDIPPQ